MSLSHTLITQILLTFVQALAAALAPRAKALRNGKIENIESINLVPGDVIIIRLGDIVPADVKILEEDGGMIGEETPMQVRAGGNSQPGMCSGLHERFESAGFCVELAQSRPARLASKGSVSAVMSSAGGFSSTSRSGPASKC